jgi:hypothetical protein
MNSICAAKNEIKKERAFTATVFKMEPDLPANIRYAAIMYERNPRFAFLAAEAYAKLYIASKNREFLDRMETLAGKAEDPNVSEAIYLKLYEVTKDFRYAQSAIDAGRRAN